ncbi:hypothetical protein [Roseomonas chloroacetimidivorans]
MTSRGYVWNGHPSWTIWGARERDRIRRHRRLIRGATIALLFVALACVGG